MKKKMIKSEIKTLLVINLDDGKSLYLLPRERMVIDESMLHSKELQKLYKQKFISIYEVEEQVDKS